MKVFKPAEYGYFREFLNVCSHFAAKRQIQICPLIDRLSRVIWIPFCICRMDAPRKFYTFREGGHNSHAQLLRDVLVEDFPARSGDDDFCAAAFHFVWVHFFCTNATFCKTELLHEKCHRLQPNQDFDQLKFIHLGMMCVFHCHWFCFEASRSASARNFFGIVRKSSEKSPVNFSQTEKRCSWSISSAYKAASRHVCADSVWRVNKETQLRAPSENEQAQSNASPWINSSRSQWIRCLWCAWQAFADTSGTKCLFRFHRSLTRPRLPPEFHHVPSDFWELSEMRVRIVTLEIWQNSALADSGDKFEVHYSFCQPLRITCKNCLPHSGNLVVEFNPWQRNRQDAQMRRWGLWFRHQQKAQQELLVGSEGWTSSDEKSGTSQVLPPG